MSETIAVNAAEKTSNRFDLLLRAVCAALLVAATIICAGLTVYYGNEVEFPFEIRALFFPMFIFGLLLFLVLSLVQFPFKKTLYFCIANYLVFCLGICLYFQSYWFLWDLGPLMAGEFWWDWAEHGKNTIIESGLYIALIALFIWGRKWLYNNLVKISLVIIAVEVICLFPMAFKPKEDHSYNHYSIDKTKKFEFAKDKNVIICVLDCFSTPLMEELLRQSPELKEEFSDFTMYTRLIAKKPLTKYAVPAIMTGENLTCGYYDPIDNQTLSSLYLNEKKSILLKMNKAGFKTEVYPCELWADGQMSFYYDRQLMSNIIPKNDDNPLYEISPDDIQKYIYAVCLRICPLRIKSLAARKCRLLYERFLTVSANEQVPDNASAPSNKKTWDNTKLPNNIQFYQELKKQACKGSEPCVFKYYHLKGVHNLFDTDENLNHLTWTSPSASLTKENYMKMAKGCIKLMRELITQLKRIGVYDNSVVIFMGDHGRMEEVMGLKCEIVGEHNPMLLVKMFNEKHPQMNVNSDILLQTDICQIPLWSDPDSIDSNYTWGSEFNSKQKDERLSVWKSYQNKESNLYFKQSGKFELEQNPPDFSKSVKWSVDDPNVESLSLENPKVEGANLYGDILMSYNSKELCSIWLVNSNNKYKLSVRATQFIFYDGDVSNVSDGEYDMYYLLESDAGIKLIQFPHCKIVVKNKMPVVKTE